MESLDSQRGLRRLSAQDGAAVWEVVPTSSRVQLIDPPAAADAGTVAVRVSQTVPTEAGDPRTPTAVGTSVPAGTGGRTLVVAETVDSRWLWTVDGAAVTPAAPTLDGGGTDPSLQQAGIVAAPVPVTVAFDGSSRSAWLWGQAAVLFAVLLLALPSRRAEDDDDGDAFQDDPVTASVEEGARA